MKSDEQCLEKLLKESLQVIRIFEPVINSHILEFFVEDHWRKIPNSWRLILECLNPPAYAELLKFDGNLKILWPLSILALRKLVYRLAIDRTYEDNINNFELEKYGFLETLKSNNIFLKRIKSKKKHELDRLAPICAKAAEKHSVRHIVDFGAGIGHLARRLSFEYSFQTCCIEMQSELNEEACKLDEEFFAHATKHPSHKVCSEYSKPVHITMELTASTTPELLLRSIRNAFKMTDTEDFTFGIVGLHACGNLSAVLLNLFVKIKEAKFLCIIGCCYMKLNTNSASTGNINVVGYPLSQYLRNYGEVFHNLSYESREVACHAVEAYAKKLESGNYQFLKIHAYRASLEKLLVKYFPDLKRIGLKAVKHVENLNFSEYVKLAIIGMTVELTDDAVNSLEISNDLRQWKRVVIFYTLRIMLAPLIESVILYDRLLYLLEHSCETSISSIFDPSLSPRNHIIMGFKA